MSDLPMSKVLFSLEGRIPRSTYWLKFLVPYLVVFVLLVAVDGATGTLDAAAGIGVRSGMFAIAAFYPAIAVAVKRCHDRNRTGWFMLVGLIPIVNLWPAIELGFLRGTVGPNKYGTDPLGP